MFHVYNIIFLPCVHCSVLTIENIYVFFLKRATHGVTGCSAVTVLPYHWAGCGLV